MFRTSKTKNQIAIAARTLAYASVLWISTLWLFPSLIIRAENEAGVSHFSLPFQLGIAATVFFVSAVINLHSAYSMVTIGNGTPLPMDCAPKLVVRGFYRYVRNPMAIGGLGMGMAVGIAHGSFGVLAYIFAGMAFWNFVVRPIEERDLLARFGASYEDYQRQVKCWIPTFRFDVES